MIAFRADAGSAGRMRPGRLGFLDKEGCYH